MQVERERPVLALVNLRRTVSNVGNPCPSEGITFERMLKPHRSEPHGLKEEKRRKISADGCGGALGLVGEVTAHQGRDA